MEFFKNAYIKTYQVLLNVKHKMFITIHHSPAKIGPEMLSVQVLVTVIERLVRNVTK